MNQLIFKDEYSSINEDGRRSVLTRVWKRFLQAIDKARIRLDANVNMELCHGADASGDEGAD